MTVLRSTLDPASPAYFNTGCWTNQNPTYVVVGDSGVSLRTYAPLGAFDLPPADAPDAELDDLEPRIA